MKFTTARPKNEIWQSRYKRRLKLPYPPNHSSRWKFRPRYRPEMNPKRIPSQASPRLSCGVCILIDQLEQTEYKTAQQRSRGHIHDVVLLGEQAAQPDERRKRKYHRPKAGAQVQRGDHGHRSVHARKAVRAAIKTLHE